MMRRRLWDYLFARYRPRQFLLGVGGSVSLTYPFDLIFQTYREWDHYSDPVSPRPPHNFYTLAKMNRPLWTPAGKCLAGSFSSRKDMDRIFQCDVPIILEKSAKYPGAWYCIGNEENFSPPIGAFDYVYQYEKYIRYIWSIDPYARVMPGGITLPKPWKYWLGQVLVNYAYEFMMNMPVTMWSIHPYSEGWPDGKLAGERTCQNIIDFREYVDAYGYSDTPLVLGEFGSGGKDQTPEELIHYIKVVGPWLARNERKMKISAVYWWGSQVGDMAMGNSGLFDHGKITPVGDAYIAYVGRYGFIGQTSTDPSRVRGSVYNPYRNSFEAQRDPSARGRTLIKLGGT